MKTITPLTLLAIAAGVALIGCGGGGGDDSAKLEGIGSTAGNGSTPGNGSTTGGASAGGGATAGGGSSAGGSTAGGGTSSGGSSAGGGTSAGGGSTGGSTAGGGTSAGGTSGGSTGGSGGTGMGPAAPGDVTSVNIGISGVTGNASTLPIASFAEAASEVMVSGSTVNVSVGQLNTGGLLSRTLNLAFDDSSIAVGDTYALNVAGPNGADVDLIQAIGLPGNLARWSAASGGAIRVVAKNGNDVTLQIENVHLDANVGNGVLSTGGLNLNGTVRFTLP